MVLNPCIHEAYTGFGGPTEKEKGKKREHDAGGAGEVDPGGKKRRGRERVNAIKRHSCYSQRIDEILHKKVKIKIRTKNQSSYSL